MSKPKESALKNAKTYMEGEKKGKGSCIKFDLYKLDQWLPRDFHILQRDRNYITCITLENEWSAAAINIALTWSELWFSFVHHNRLFSSDTILHFPAWFLTTLGSW